MLTRLFAWAIAILILFQNLAVGTSAQAATTQPVSTTIAFAQANNKENTKTLTFSDTEAFYKELATVLASKAAISVNTPFNGYEQFPPRLKQVFELQKPNGMPAIPGAVAAAPFSNETASLSIHYGALISAGASAAVGAGVGGTLGSFWGGVGAAPGALGGAGVGLSTWAVSQAITQNCYKVVLQVSIDSSLTISLEPVCPFLA